MAECTPCVTRPSSERRAAVTPAVGITQLAPTAGMVTMMHTVTYRVNAKRRQEVKC